MSDDAIEDEVIEDTILEDEINSDALLNDVLSDDIDTENTLSVNEPANEDSQAPEADDALIMADNR